MNDDLLAAYRKPGSTPAGRAAPTPAAPPVIIMPPPVRYHAFAAISAGEKPFRLEMRGNDGVRIVRAYAALNELLYLDDYTLFRMQFAQGLVAVQGFHLSPVIEAILAQRCEWIAELRDGEDGPPEGEPVIMQMRARVEGQPTNAGRGEGK